MRLTRRDALAALSAAGISAAAGCSAPDAETWGEGAPPSSDGDDARDPDTPELGEDDLEALVALAGVLYPSEVENAAEFVEEWVRPRVRERPEHGRGMLDALETLDDYAENLEGEHYVDLDPEAREELLSYMAVDIADPDPHGDDDERVRYYLVNDLLFGLYASPTGASLAGLENPPGYPGGTASYQRGPK
jgi:hypothetical protein